MTETDLINAKISFMGRGRTPKEITQSILDEYRKGEKRQDVLDMLEADEYFLCRNTAISEKERGYMGADGQWRTNETLSNAKVPAGFLRSNVLQKVNYSVGKPFTLTIDGPIEDAVDEATGEKVIDPLKEQYSQEWLTWADANRRKTLKRIVRDGVNKGKGWAYVSIIDGDLEIEDNEPAQTYPAWTDKPHTILDALVYEYIQIQYDGTQRKEVRKVDFYTPDGVDRFVDDGGLDYDPDHQGVEAHMSRETKDGVQNISWGRVPFIALKGNEDELPMLNVIRQQIDAYDALQSKSVDALVDDIDPVLVVENISPEMGDLTKARQSIQNARIVSLDKDGKAYYVQVNPDISAIQTKLETLRKDIREFGSAVDTQDVKFGSNPSGVALKSMYQDLDIYVNGLETEIEVFFQSLKYFFDIWLQFKGVGTADQWSGYKLTVTLDRDMMINTSADIQETVMLMSTGVSTETLDNWNPAVESHEIEQQRREREQNSQLDQMKVFRQQAGQEEDA